VVVAYRGNIRLAAEIALASSAQVAVFLIPAVALLSWLIDPLSLAFRLIEIVAVGGSVVFTALLLFRGYSTRWRGAVLVAAYAVVAYAFYAVGDRAV
jgi:Ca2+:H+ antiporter